MNKVFLLGNICKDIDLKYTQNNVIPVAKFSLAVSRKFQKPGEDKQTDFLNIVVWNKLAEFVQKYFEKGSKIIVIGRIQTRTWDDDKGVKHYGTEVIAEEIHFAGSKKPTFNNTENYDNNEILAANGDELPF